MLNSSRKGKAGERELAAKITELFGVPARRGQQFAGGTDSPDVVHGLAGLHLECKRTEKLNLWPAIEQATNDAGDNVPAVCHRPNRKEWVFICHLADLPRLAALIHGRMHNNAFPLENAPQMRAEQSEVRAPIGEADTGTPPRCN